MPDSNSFCAEKTNLKDWMKAHNFLILLAKIKQIHLFKPFRNIISDFDIELL